MAISKIDVEHFLKLQHQMPLLDVRSPSEFQYAQIPGAFSLPLFSDEERKVVGTLYKQEGKQRAIKEGLDYFGPKMRGMVSQVEKMVEIWKEKKTADVYLTEEKKVPLNDITEGSSIIIHCWRGGMRSGAVAWLLDLYGFQVYQLIGGYKAYRNWALGQFQKQYAFRMLAGYTGSGKTNMLHRLKGNGETVLDLEMLANHKGSAFGGIGLPPQPSQEMFENFLATALFNIGNQPCWVEDESQRIGQLHIPHSLWKTMRTKPVFFMEIPFAERLQFITEHYGKCDPQQMQQSIERIQKRLGPLETKTAIQHLQQGELEACFTILLKYYDKYYLKGLTSRENLEGLINKIPCCNVDSLMNAEKLIACVAATT